MCRRTPTIANVTTFLVRKSRDKRFVLFSSPLATVMSNIINPAVSELVDHVILRQVSESSSLLVVEMYKCVRGGELVGQHDICRSSAHPTRTISVQIVAK